MSLWEIYLYLPPVCQIINMVHCCVYHWFNIEANPCRILCVDPLFAEHNAMQYKLCIVFFTRNLPGTKSWNLFTFSCVVTLKLQQQHLTSCLLCLHTQLLLVSIWILVVKWNVIDQPGNLNIIYCIPLWFNPGCQF